MNKNASIRNTVFIMISGCIFMSTKLFSTAIVLLMVVSLPAISLADAEESPQMTASGTNFLDIDSFCDAQSIDTSKLQCENSEALESIAEQNYCKKPIIINSDVLTRYASENQSTIKNVLKTGSPLIINGNSDVLKNAGMTVAINPVANCTVLYLDNNTNNMYCFGIESAEDSMLGMAISWAESAKLALPEYDNALYYQETKICDGDKARINASATYFLVGSNSGNNFYGVRYQCESVTNNSKWHTADITVSCDVDGSNSFQHLIDYGPDNTEGTKTESINVGLSVGFPISASVNAAMSWSYTVPTTFTHCRCDKSEDKFDIWHDIDEKYLKKNNITSARVSPGMVVSVAKGSVYLGDDNFSVTYKKPYSNHLWPWDPDTELKTYELTCHALISSQGE